MLEELRRQNPHLPLFSVEDAAFSEYGRLLPSVEIAPLLAASDTLPFPDAGSSYVASLEGFEALPVANEIRDLYFGTLDTQLGYCYGHSNALNALEWHTSSEINVALTPLVLMLAKRQDIRNGMLDSSLVKAFYLPAGTTIECYATTLHFCPCEVTEQGFRMVVALPRGTNEPLASPTPDPLLFRRNKWLIAHEKNEALLARGAVSGICGENLTLHGVKLFFEEQL